MSAVKAEVVKIEIECLECLWEAGEGEREHETELEGCQRMVALAGTESLVLDEARSAVGPGM